MEKTEQAMTPRRTARQADVLSEVVAALLWMHLTLPPDISRAELEGCSRELIRAVRLGAGGGLLEQKLKTLQAEQFAQPVNGPAIRQLARAIAELVERRPHLAAPVRKAG
jgi:hypothetical protein